MRPVHGALRAACAGAALIALVSALASSCGGDEADGSGGSGAGTTGTGGAAGGHGGSGGGANVDNLHVHAQDGLQQTAIADVTVCVATLPAIPCAATDAQGNVRFTVPPNGPVYVSLVKQGYASALLGSVITASEDLFLTAPLVASGLANIVAQSGGVTLDPAKAQIALAAVGPPPNPNADYPGEPGVSFTLTPMSGSGPHYGNDINLIDPSLTATAGRGAALYFNVDAADYVVTAIHPSDTCTPLSAIAGSAPNTFDVWTQVGFVTYVSMLCDDGGGGAGGAGGAGAGGGGAGGGVAGAAGAGGG